MWARDMCLAWGHAGLRALLSRKVLRIRSRRGVEIAFNHKNDEIIVEVSEEPWRTAAEGAPCRIPRPAGSLLQLPHHQESVTKSISPFVGLAPCSRP